MSGYDLLTPDFAGHRLGDIVFLPDGRSQSIRMLAPLPSNDLGLGSLVLLGELEVMLATRGRGVDVLLPVEQFPLQLSSARRLLDGAASYWSPHLPALTDAMGEVLYRLLMLRSSFAPAVTLTRGADLVAFVKTGEMDLDDLRILRMPRSEHTNAPISRYAAVVEPTGHPAWSPRPTSPVRQVPARQIPVPAR